MSCCLFGETKIMDSKHIVHKNCNLVDYNQMKKKTVRYLYNTIHLRSTLLISFFLSSNLNVHSFPDNTLLHKRPNYAYICNDHIIQYNKYRYINSGILHIFLSIPKLILIIHIP